MNIQTITAMQARKQFGDIMNRVALTGQEFIVERSGKPLGAFVPIETLMTIKKNKKAAYADLQKIWKKMKGFPATELEDMIDEAVKQVRKK